MTFFDEHDDDEAVSVCLFCVCLYNLSSVETPPLTRMMMLRELTSDDHVHHHHHDAEDKTVEVVSETVMAISSDNINDAKLKELSNALVVLRFEVSPSVSQLIIMFNIMTINLTDNIEFSCIFLSCVFVYI